MPWPPPSAVPQLFLSNRAPSEIEADLLLNIVSSAESDLNRIRRQLEANPKNRVLKNQLRTYEIYIIRHKSILSPLRRLPPELLCQIFELFASRQVPLDRSHIPSHWSDSPWSISQVCHRWRAITLSMPLLWTRIPLVTPFMKYDTSQSFLEFYTRFLLRSAGLPISVFVSWKECGPTGLRKKTVKWHPAIKILISHSHRWQHLSIVSPSPYLLRAFRPIKKRLPILRTLNLELSPEACLDVFQKAPKLSQIRLIEADPDRIALPWKQLLHYKGRHDEMFVIEPLRLSPLLETLELQNCCDDFPSESQFPPIVLPNLVLLNIHWIVGREFTVFLLESLVTPAVEEITMFSDWDDVPLIETLTAMITRSTNASVLHRLSLGSSCHHPGDLISLLRLTPRLVSLDVSFPAVEDLIRLTEVYWAGDTSPIVPTLSAKANIMNILARARCEEASRLLSDLDTPDIISSCPRTPHTVPLREFRLKFLTNSHMHRAQGLLNNWELYPSKSADLELMLFCNWASELDRIFDHLVPNINFKRTKNFIKWMEPLTKAQKIMAFTKTMVNHKLQDVEHLFKSRLLIFLSHISCTVMPGIPSPIVEGIRAQASFVLQRWQRRIRAGLSIHHCWVSVGDNSLCYIPKYESDLWTPEAAVDAVTRGLHCKPEEIKDRSELPPLPKAPRAAEL